MATADFRHFPGRCYPISRHSLHYRKSPEYPEMVCGCYLEIAIAHADLRGWRQILNLSGRGVGRCAGRGGHPWFEPYLTNFYQPGGSRRGATRHVWGDWTRGEGRALINPPCSGFRRRTRFSASVDLSCFFNRRPSKQSVGPKVSGLRPRYPQWGAPACSKKCGQCSAVVPSSPRKCGLRTPR